jgi:hypothetical protein
MYNCLKKEHFNIGWVQRFDWNGWTCIQILRDNLICTGSLAIKAILLSNVYWRFQWLNTFAVSGPIRTNFISATRELLCFSSRHCKKSGVNCVDFETLQLACSGTKLALQYRVKMNSTIEDLSQSRILHEIQQSDVALLENRCSKRALYLNLSIFCLYIGLGRLSFKSLENVLLYMDYIRPMYRIHFVSYRSDWCLIG